MSSSVECRFGNLLAIKSTNCNVDKRSSSSRDKRSSREGETFSEGPFGVGGTPFFLDSAMQRRINRSPLNCKSGKIPIVFIHDLANRPTFEHFHVSAVSYET